MLRMFKIAAVVIAALIVLKIVVELLSFITSFWFIVAAVAVINKIPATMVSIR